MNLPKLKGKIVAVLLFSLILPCSRVVTKLDLSHYKMPTFDLLRKQNEGEVSIDNEEQIANKQRIIETLGNYGIKISSISATVGPTVTLYEIVPEAGVRISKIRNLEDDIALSLSALGINRRSSLVTPPKIRRSTA